MAFIPKYILILFFLIIIDYTAGIVIEKATAQRRKKYLILSLVANIATLALFKYFNFINANLESIAQFLHWNYSIKSLSIILPIGLSFHTFQSMSYTIEVYYGRQKAERNFGIYALYVLFYPQLVAGPIERPQNLLEQFHTPQVFNFQRVLAGLKLMAAGLFKKIFIADRIAVLVNQVYGNPQQHDGLHLLLATYFFAIQIYCDFSGYTDVARGASEVMGFKLMRNFNSPYIAQSISEFWKRWHISLSTWFRDYLYIPLGGNRTTKPRWYFNLFFTFLVSGLWHGANWTFVAWGALHGTYLISSLITQAFRSQLLQQFGLTKDSKLLTPIRIFITFHLVCIAWIFFRASNLSDALYILTHLGFSLSTFQIDSDMIISFSLIGILGIIHWIAREKPMLELLANRPRWFRWSFYYLFIVCSLGLLLLSKPQTPQQFIYFQF